MPLTPAEIHNREFAKASLGRRGYDEDQVDSLLDEVSGEMIRLLEENDALQRSLPPPGRQGAGRAEAEYAEAEFNAAVAELGRARRACDQAEAKARHMQSQLEEARRSALARTTVIRTEEIPDAVLSMAQRTADDHLLQAQEESRALNAEARERSERVTREARQLVSDIEENMRRHQSEAAAALTTGRADLLREIEELTEFAKNYRAALQEHMLRQGQLLSGVSE